MLWERGSVQIGEHRVRRHQDFPDAPLVGIFLNIRSEDHPKKPGPLARQNMLDITALMLDAVKQRGWNYKKFAGIPAAGEAFADAVEKLRPDDGTRPRVYLKKEEVNGERHIVGVAQGSIQGDDPLLLLDDVITGADTKLEAARAAERMLLRIAGIVVLVDREQGGMEELRRANIPCVAVFTLTDLLDFYVSKGFMTEADHRLVVERNHAFDTYIQNAQAAR